MAPTMPVLRHYPRVNREAMQEQHRLATARVLVADHNRVEADERGDYRLLDSGLTGLRASYSSDVLSHRPRRRRPARRQI
jgi:hypothetical protein